MRIRPFALLVLAIALIAPEAAAADTIIVKREPGLTRAERADIRADAGVRLVEALEPPRTELVSAAPGEADAALAALAADPAVEYAAPNVRLRAAAAPPSDPSFAQQWGFENGGDTDIDLLEAWDRAPTRGAGVLVAVVDGGVSSAHPEFAGRIAIGDDFVAGDCDPSDPYWSSEPDEHGTHVAGTIAAAVDGAGTVGAAPAAGVRSLRALDACGSGYLSWIVDAFEQAALDGAEVVNASLATPPGVYTAAERSAIDAAFADVIGRHPNVLYVVAAGNDGSDNDALPVYPCNADVANLVCVGASTSSDGAAWFSNRGHASVDLFAPGADIRSTVPGGYASFDGTSMAAPHVAGAAALIRGERPSLDGVAIKAALLDGAEPKPAFAGLAVRPARLNAAASLADAFAETATAPPAPPVAPSTPTAPAPTPTAPRPPADRDGDGRPDASDACPAERAGTADGCPLPAVTKLSAKARRRTVTIRVTASRAATVRVTVERKRCARGRCRWLRVARRTVATRTGSAKVVLRRLKRGSYRAVVALPGGAGATKGFRVR